MTTLLIDVENVFYWSHPDPGRLPRDSFRNRARMMRMIDPGARPMEAMRKAPLVFEALLDWLRAGLGPELDVRGYGKVGDGGVRGVLPLIAVGRWTHVHVSPDDDAADHALVGDLEDRSRRPDPQVFVIGASDQRTVLKGANRVAAGSPHTYLVLLGPNCLPASEFTDAGSLPHLRLHGSISEIYADVIRTAKAGSPRSTDGSEPGAGSAAGGVEIERALAEVERDTFITEVVRLAREIGEQPQRRRARQVQCLVRVAHETWIARFGQPGDLAGYAGSQKVPRGFEECRSLREVGILERVLAHALAHSRKPDDEDVRQRIDVAAEAARARLGPPADAGEEP